MVLQPSPSFDCLLVQGRCFVFSDGSGKQRLRLLLTSWTARAVTAPTACSAQGRGQKGPPTWRLRRAATTPKQVARIESFRSMFIQLCRQQAPKSALSPFRKSREFRVTVVTSQNRNSLTCRERVSGRIEQRRASEWLGLTAATNVARSMQPSIRRKESEALIKAESRNVC